MTIHKAAKVNPKGDVSPLCAKVPRKINLKRESWTFIPRLVTCEKCLAAMKVEGVYETIPEQ
jgi:hypothetical protein